MAFISKKCGVFKRYWFTKERIDVRYALVEVARDKRFVELLHWRSEELFFTQENLADCVVDRTHTIKTWTGLMKWNTYQGHEFEKPFATVLFIRRRPEVCCYVPLLQQKTSLPSLVSLSRAHYFQAPLTQAGHVFDSSLTASNTKRVNLTWLPLEIMYRGHTWHDYLWPWVSLTWVLYNLQLDDVLGADFENSLYTVGQSEKG